ncbi:hypothetical protein [Maribacter sp. R77961]|uniref:hypothetical protein n=1 Tax=Maribacter sp. R77961 TaxID=3093871 RepID=UPI0037CC8E12
MKKSHLILILILLVVEITYACSCPFRKLAEMQKREVENSECIFVGKVTEVKEDLTYKIIVMESLDGGDLQGNVYIGQNWKYCYPYVEEEGTWLFYGRMENGFFKLNSCGLSRAFDNPFAPTSESKELDEYGAKMELEKIPDAEILNGMFRIDLANEIAALRKRRDYTVKASS